MAELGRSNAPRPTCEDGEREHFAPTGSRPRPLTADDAIGGLTRLHSALMQAMEPVFQGQPNAHTLFAGILDAVRENDERFPLESNRPGWLRRSAKGRAMQRAQFYSQLWLLGDGIAHGDLKDHVFQPYPAKAGNAVLCLAATLRGAIDQYACGYFGLAMHGLDQTLHWDNGQVACVHVATSPTGGSHDHA